MCHYHHHRRRRRRRRRHHHHQLRSETLTDWQCMKLKMLKPE